tara:strand:- start:852 stop:1013 length:162 start_codon:yes stop_codon:yes gene_type:complete
MTNDGNNTGSFLLYLIAQAIALPLAHKGFGWLGVVGAFIVVNVFWVKFFPTDN